MLALLLSTTRALVIGQGFSMRERKREKELCWTRKEGKVRGWDTQRKQKKTTTRRQIQQRRKSSGTTIFKLNMCIFILFVSSFSPEIVCLECVFRTFIFGVFFCAASFLGRFDFLGDVLNVWFTMWKVLLFVELLRFQQLRDLLQKAIYG